MNWQVATVLDVCTETPSAKTFRLNVSGSLPHRAGQHYLVRLTAPDGYRAQRSYSVASAPRHEEIELTVELLAGGEVSTFLHDVVEPGDELEVRGPIGRYFAWDVEDRALGISGGSGVVPLMSMLRQARAVGRPDLIHLVTSARSPADVFYASELQGPETTIAFTRQAPAGYRRPVGRLTPADLEPYVAGAVTVYVCGSPAFCDSATRILLDLGVPTGTIRVERFGPSG
jgi:ferredoxin-NADP reductase